MKLTFKEFLKQNTSPAKEGEFKRAMKKKKKGNQYPTRGVKDVVDHDKARTNQSYRASNALGAPVSGVGGMGG